MNSSNTSNININKNTYYKNLMFGQKLLTPDNPKSSTTISLPSNNKVITSADFLNTRNYTVAFLGNKAYSANENAFISFREKISDLLRTVKTQYAQAEWNFLVNSNDNTEKLFSEKQQQLSAVYKNDSIFSQLKKIQKKGVNHAILKRQLNEFIQAYEKHNNPQFAEIETLQNNVLKKFNQYEGQGVINGREYLEDDLNRMLQEESDPQKTQNIKAALNGAGELVSKDLIELVKARNAFAQKMGYPDYYSYVLKVEHGINKDKLFRILDSLEDKTNTIYEKMLTESPDDPTVEASNYIGDNDVIIKLSESLYRKMGWENGNFPIKYDLFPRKNKYPRGMCFAMDIPNDIRLIENLNGDIANLKSLNHEKGHGTYYNGISKHLTYIDKKPISHVVDEAVAFIMDKLPYTEKGFLKKELNMPEELIDRLNKYQKKELLENIRFWLTIAHFEKKMYEDPDQDLTKLWYDLNKDIMKNDPPANLAPEWANISNFISEPASCQKYILAALMSTQIYNAVNKKLGPLTENKDTRVFFENNIYKYGNTITEDQLLMNLTGSKLKPDDFIKELESIAT